MQIAEIVIGLKLFENCLSPNKLTSELEQQIYDLILPFSIALSNNSQRNKYINKNCENYPSGTEGVCRCKVEPQRPFLQYIQAQIQWNWPLLNMNKKSFPLEILKNGAIQRLVIQR